MKKPIKPTQDTFTLALKAQTGIIAVKEYMFHDKRKWRFDYAIPDKKVAIEVDGGIWSKGRHIQPKGMLGDMDKFNAAAVLGWRILKVTPQTLFNLSTFEMIIQSTL
jgi:very-short-patch-repair endonuclease